MEQHISVKHFVLIQALITLHVLQTLLSDINIKPKSTRSFIAKAAWSDPLFGFPATFETPCLNGVYRIAIFYLPLNKYDHSSRLTSFHWRKHLHWHSTVSTVKGVTCVSEPGKYRFLYVGRRYGRCMMNRSCSWPTGGVDGMVGSGLLSINETRQSPAVQLQLVQTPSQLIATSDDPEECVIVWKRPEKKKKRLKESEEVKNFSLSQQLIKSTAPWYDMQACSCN